MRSETGLLAPPSLRRFVALFSYIEMLHLEGDFRQAYELIWGDLR